MKADIDKLMEEAGLAALLVIGGATHNPNMTYLVGQVHLTKGYLIQGAGKPALLLHQAMERDEAARSGLETRTFDDYDFALHLKDASGDSGKATAMMLDQVFRELEISGRVALYGKVELGPTFVALDFLQELNPEIKFVGEIESGSTLLRARETKGEDEIDRIRAMGKITTEVVEDVADFLRSHRIKDNFLVNRAGEALTIGEVKRRINLWLTMRGADNPEGTIFAIGRDAGVPHSTGMADQPVEIGKTIVFDIFPTENGGGYFFDFTRTWCLGHASEEAKAIYQDVSDVYHEVLEKLEPNGSCREYQLLTCELFEASGHPTVLNTPKTQEGYVHSLGHGLGLSVHENPKFSHLDSNQDRLKPGTVFTFEPGLYYPEREIGVRLENTFFVNPDGGIEPLAEYPMDFVLEIHEAE
jgi:Xaa-Pro aminopeptidase